MSRVWKKFFIKVGKGVAFIAGFSAWMITVYMSLYMSGLSDDAISIIGPVISLLVPIAIVMLRMTYKDCKQEVEKENRELVRNLGGKY